MTALLDTHTFIWMDTDASRLSQTVVGYFTDPNCTILLSVASAWEIAIKTATGRLKLSGEIEQVIRDVQARNPLRLLPVELAHALALRTLPSIHKDPFDRMLVAQAIAENAVLLTSDPLVRRYPVRTDW